MISRRTLCGAIATVPVWATVPGLARAADNDIVLMQSEITKHASGFQLSAVWEFDLANTLIESLHRGIALYFVCNFRLQRQRWYWFDKDLSDVELVQRISFSPLSRTYRLSRGGLSQTFDSLDQALSLVKHIREWPVIDLSFEKDLDDLDAEVRMRLDASRLPKPLQVTIGGNSDWNLDSDWLSVSLPRIE
ncbi:MAG: DUF4390 domain-containing protein [Sutterellaceae bacterium]|nr:DUF4390 domain-containing protein [Sutterellaceae bacterium]